MRVEVVGKLRQRLWEPGIQSFANLIFVLSSRSGHEKPWLNLGGPPSKAKYSSMTDSEQVPRGKGEKYRCERSEIVPAIICLQGVKARKGDSVPFA
jgi:hypothetical protein